MLLNSCVVVRRSIEVVVNRDCSQKGTHEDIHDLDEEVLHDGEQEHEVMCVVAKGGPDLVLRLDLVDDESPIVGVGR